MVHRVHPVLGQLLAVCALDGMELMTESARVRESLASRVETIGRLAERQLAAGSTSAITVAVLGSIARSRDVQRQVNAIRVELEGITPERASAEFEVLDAKVQSHFIRNEGALRGSGNGTGKRRRSSCSIKKSLMRATQSNSRTKVCVCL